ncbi:hypothetical protein GX48_02587 [Paracoccidioides brasiliensis]|nr:hypothetical protein GX48_02587 [Paracoccidioides brasiliensis]
MLSLSSRPFDPINSVELMNYDERGDVRSESFVSQETRAKLFLLDCVRSERRSHQLEEHEHYAGTRRTARPSENITGQAVWQCEKIMCCEGWDYVLSTDFDTLTWKRKYGGQNLEDTR